MALALANSNKLLEQMGKSRKGDQASSAEAIEELTEHLHERVDSGWAMPSGWMFKGLTLHFLHESEEVSSSEGPLPKHSSRLHLAKNIARFAGAGVTSSLTDSSITHIIVGPDTLASEVSVLRKTLSTRKKLPHIVKVDWIEESWKERTILDEERKFTSCLSASRKQTNLVCLGFQPSRKSP
jgi:DNA ligase-4